MNDTINNALSDIEFLQIIKPILEKEEFQKRIKFQHFNDISMYEHALKVSYNAFINAKKHNFSSKEILEVTIASLLHNFYPDTKESKNFKPTDALIHASKYFNDIINYNIASAILCHKFPYTLTNIPNNKIALLVNITDSFQKIGSTSSKDNIEKHINKVTAELPFNFFEMHSLFQNFLNEYKININKRSLQKTTSFALRLAFLEYLNQINPNIDQTILGEAVKNTVKREELLSKINLILDNIDAYTIQELSNILDDRKQGKQKSLSQK